MAINTISSKATRQIFSKTSVGILFNKSAFKRLKSNSCLYVLNKSSLLPEAYKYLSFIKSNTNFQQSAKFSINYSTKFQQSNSSNSSENVKNQVTLKIAVKYGLFVLIGVVGGVITGYWLMLDQFKIGYDNETKRTIKYEPTKLIEHTNSKYSNFPLTLHVYQYESCPYCSQIRAYLDYFGFNYYLTEVDSYSKYEIIKFTKARTLPIVVIQDKQNKKRWHLANSTAVISALESLRNDKRDNYVNILNLYLPVLKGNSINNAHNPYKYHVNNSNLNDIEWRKWVNNVAIPVFKVNSMASLKDLFESFDYIADKSDWHSRYGPIKYYFVYYMNLFKTYKKFNSLYEQLNTKMLPRDILHETLNVWENGLGDKKFISGTQIPNLADISMFGNVRAYEGCALFRESIAKHPKFRTWYENMKKEIVRGYSRHEKNKHGILFYLQSLDSDQEEELSKPVELNKIETLPSKSKVITKQETTQTDLDSSLALLQNSSIIKNQELSQITLFRVLTLNYMVNLIAFIYAGYMGK